MMQIIGTVTNVIAASHKGDSTYRLRVQPADNAPACWVALREQDYTRLVKAYGFRPLHEVNFILEDYNGVLIEHGWVSDPFG